ncbi:hypothetical protein B0T10DRAFT_91707 [Thelonectria olida]|uniref:VOC domain-containing protein n=1 Tax=Thelonectria olida TaxID=1576542 RepID=A0A9P8VYJ2_9HYPO|nr:hypothetical protein B0T10DRAFT_91707 [Thelonectria olida]
MVHFTSLLSTALLLASPLTSACVTHMPVKRDNSTYPYADYGSDTPADIATTGYAINHLCLNVRNITNSVEFYSSIFGMRKLFTFHASEHYSVTYMAHSHGGRNGTGYQTTEELIREKNNAKGMLELINIDVPENALPASTLIANTFGHIGMVVPDIEATQARLDAFPGISTLKRYGEDLSLYSRIATATSLSAKMLAQLPDAEKELIMATLVPFNKPFIIVTDPDGNMIEIQAQEGEALPQ